MGPAASRKSESAAERPPSTEDRGGAPIDRLLRIGAAAVGCPLLFTEAGALGDAGGGRFAALPDRAFEHLHPVIGPENETLGTLRAIDLASRAPLDASDRAALADVASLIAGDICAERRIGETDHITGMPNRRRFERDFARAVETTGKGPVVLLVTLADARKYGELLRALGHVHAEAFVRSGGKMVAELAGPTALVCHVSILSFAFLVEGANAEPLAREMLQLFAEPVMCGTLPIATKIGVGIAPITKLEERPSEVLRFALAAAQDSRLYDCGYAHYDPKIDAAFVRAFRLLTDLDDALRDYGQLSLAYQPRIALGSGGLVGCEALVRWTHPLLGPISPADFIPLAETTALIGPLTDFVMTRAFRQASAWRRDGLDVPISVNISPTILHDGDFLERADDILQGAKIDPAHVEFEFTEGVFTSSEPRVRANVEGVRARGISIAIDDFGMGYSNLNAITRLPADVLKVDRSLVQAIDVEPRRRRLCHALIELAQDLDFRVVAEGIETQAVYDMLVDWRCDEGQGYLMSRPLPANDFAAFAKAR